jgi:hypothetical protein
MKCKHAPWISARLWDKSVAKPNTPYFQGAKTQMLSMVALLVVTLLEVCKQVGQILVLEPFLEALRHQ